MREHKYRAWDKKQKKWLGPNLHMSVTDGCLWWQFGYGCEILSVEERENIELVEDTGLKDENGKEIYEGDILRIFDRNYEVKIIETDSKMYIEYGYPDEHNGPCNFWSEIIGNIYENPELMEVEEKEDEVV